MLSRSLRWTCLFLLTSACGARGLHGSASVRDGVRPSLEEIFGEMPIDGARPTDVSVSADGSAVAYQWQPRARDGGEGDSTEAPARLFVVSSRGGERVDLGERRGAQWSPVGARLLWCEGKSVVGWAAGSPTTATAPWKTLDEDVTEIRFAPGGRLALLSGGPRRWIVQLDPSGQAGSAVEIERPAGFAIERATVTDAGLFVQFRKGGRPGRFAASGPSSREGEASRAATAPASRPRGDGEVEIAWIEPSGAVSWRRPIAAPEGWSVDQIIPDTLGALAWVVLSERDGEIRGQGMMPDFLTEKVTTRPVRGRSAKDTELRRVARLARPSDGAELMAIEGLEEPRRGSIEIVARPPRNGRARAVAAVTAEHRSARMILALSASGTGEPATSTRELLSIPGPVGGVEQIVPAGGKPFLLSERSGRARIYDFTDDGDELAPQTPDTLDVLWASRLEAGGWIAQIREPAEPYASQFARVGRDGSITGLPGGPLWAEGARLARDSSVVAFLGAELGRTEDLMAQRADGSSAPVRLTFTAPAPSDAPGAPIVPEIVSYRSGDGTTVWAYRYEPPPGIPRNGGAVIFLHGAGYLQEVRASLGFPGYVVNHHFHRRLAAMGYVVMCPDFRGSAGYGRKFRTDVFQNLGIPDSDDILAAKRFLVERGGVDGSRIGLYGGSYGGFLTLMCLLRYPTEFACGAALRSVTDWRTYSPEYTRPLLGGGPDDVPHVYARCSPIDLAESLARPVLLLHGMKDDNVFVQDTIRLVERFQKLRKTELFELMLYPSQNHTFTSPHSWIDEYRRIELFFEKHLNLQRSEGRNE
ncbi:MAG: S9 family peptidase [Planctomycetes bacterium]|nr:S9 family peptidase [Planctomycetota bacterium]